MGRAPGPTSRTGAGGAARQGALGNIRGEHKPAGNAQARRPLGAAADPRRLACAAAGRHAIPLVLQAIGPQLKRRPLDTRNGRRGDNCVGGGERVTCAVLGGAGGTHEVFMRNALPASILIKRFGAERLYDVDLRRYVVLDDLYAWQVMAVSFIVEDAKSGEDVTAAVLADVAGSEARSKPGAAAG
jgi:PHB/PHA accumulation regulator DNA-binding domain